MIRPDPTAAALFVSAPASGQGKTTLVAGLARHASRLGMRVRVFKAGADFIDPTILERASGRPVYQLDLWMGGLTDCRRLLRAAAEDADLILVEGVMGLHDGEPSSAELARLLGIPVVVVIDANAMAQTFGAVVLGLRDYRPEVPFHGVLANRVGGAAHASMLAASLSALPRPPSFLGAVPDDPALVMPERHLGLVEAAEIAHLDYLIDRAADALAAARPFDGLPVIRFPAEPAARAAPASRAEPPDPPRAPPRLLDGARIAVARDEALSFIYPANLDVLRELGATTLFFSPLRDERLPEAEAVYLPGGYPELHAERLAANRSLHEALRAHSRAGKPLLAECGGMMLLFERLIDVRGRAHSMVGLLPGETAMQPRLQALALQSVTFDQGELRGHSFHHSRLATPLEPAARGRTQHGAEGEAVFRLGRLTASYVHFYWPSNPRALAGLLAP
ncbi:MAG TPA: cobyrinate a,c-diamide synthase [Steroidobacteraceae bacterium]|nr:cobyrinate a,c-diamide synthase [Steroidobacteraceae bacterium]